MPEPTERRVTVRVTERVTTVTEVTYDVPMPPHVPMDDVETRLARDVDEVHREELSTTREITNIKRT